jgi:phage head maturation protease
MKPLVETEAAWYRITAYHDKRNDMDEIVLGITEAKELQEEWEEDGWYVDIELDSYTKDSSLIAL